MAAEQKKGLLPASMVSPAAATMAGGLEILFFHPFDTVSKRLMSNQKSLFQGNFLTNANKTIFKDYSDAGLVQKVKYLYPGSQFAIAYKILQRVYKFAGQPIVRKQMEQAGVTDALKPVCGKRSKLMTESIAGSIIGIGEIVLLPLDRLKILSQTNDAALKNRSLLSVFRAEGLGLYAGAGVTAMRNAPGSFSLFGGAAFTKEVIFGLEDFSKASVPQNLTASAVGATLSIVVTNPMDVVKTRIQNKNFGESVSGAQVVRSIMREEGPGAFFKAVGPKVSATAPKVVCAYTLTEYFIHKLKAV